MLGKLSVAEDVIRWRFEKCPNLERATMVGQRSAAQNGQYSAPMYSSSGLPEFISGVCPLRVTSGGMTLELYPTEFSALVGTCSMAFRTDDGTGRSPVVGDVLELLSLMSKKATKTAATASIDTVTAIGPLWDPDRDAGPFLLLL